MTPVEEREPTFAELLERVAAVDPLLVEAMADVDTSLLEEFAKLSFEEKITWAVRAAEGARGFRKR
jgi:hypothetical protein